ncbi:MAG: sulfurtransferase [Ilumatobacteraceae bacterium]
MTRRGFDAASVVDGGLTAWLADGRPVSSDAPVQPPATFEAHLRPELVASRDEVESMLGSDSACLVHALPQPLFSGKVPIAHGRSGRIPGSVSVPAVSLTDPATNRLKPLDHTRELYASTGALDPERRIVAY